MSKKGLICHNLLVAVIWTIWLERDKRAFNNRLSNTLKVWEDICNLTGLWTSKSKLSSRIILHLPFL